MHTNRSDTKRSIFEALSQNHFRLVFHYLPTCEVITASHVSQLWKKTVLEYLATLPSFEITNAMMEKLDIPAFSNMLAYYQRHIYPLHLVYTANNYPVACMREFLERPTPKLQKLNLTLPDLPQEKQEALLNLVVSSFPDLHSIRIYGNICSEQSITIFAALTKLEAFAVFANNAFFEGSELKELPPLRSLEINIPSVELSNLEPLLTKSTGLLEKVYLDLDYYSTSDIFSLIDQLVTVANLRYLHLQYCSELNAEHFERLNLFSKSLEALLVTKASQVTSNGYEKCFSKPFPNLQVLDLHMCNSLSNKGLELISQNCQALADLDISWCEDIKDSSLSLVLNRCTNLKRLTIVGLKHITDKSFGLMLPILEKLDRNDYQRWKKDWGDESFREGLRDKLLPSELLEESTVYHRIKHINTSKCDFISDNLFMLIKLINPCCEALNYYGEDF